jgi:hypothetical protein
MMLEDHASLHRHGGAGVDYLRRNAASNRETGAQRLMPIHQRVYRLLQAFEIQRAMQMHRQLNIVDSAAALQLIEKPQTLLGKRQREQKLLGLLDSNRCLCQFRDHYFSFARINPDSRRRPTYPQPGDLHARL